MLNVCTRTGVIDPSACATTIPGPKKPRSSVSPPTRLLAVNCRRSAVIAGAGGQMVGHPEDSEGMFDLRLNTISVGVRGRLIQEGVRTTVAELCEAKLCEEGAVPDEVRNGIACPVGQRRPVLLAQNRSVIITRFHLGRITVQRALRQIAVIGIDLHGGILVDRIRAREPNANILVLRFDPDE